MAAGQPLPRDWDPNPPEIEPDGAWILRAFWDLSSERPIGFSLGPIPWSSVVRYGARAGLDREASDVLWAHVRALDSAYLAWHAREQEERSASQSRAVSDGRDD